GSGRCPDTLPPFEKGGRKLLPYLRQPVFVLLTRQSMTACFVKEYGLPRQDRKVLPRNDTVKGSAPPKVQRENVLLGPILNSSF
ncbi:MAG: hypothetical protein II889_03620, partial [Clostridia bacterium]|nr:hypothetical protein [Clostridia bacterium]